MIENNVENNQELLGTIMATVESIVTRWGTCNRSFWDLVTPVGEISASHNHCIVKDFNSRYNSLIISDLSSTQKPRLVIEQGSIEVAERILVSISQYLVSEDFVNKIKGSISRLKRLQSALK